MSLSSESGRGSSAARSASGPTRVAKGLGATPSRATLTRAGSYGLLALSRRSSYTSFDLRSSLSAPADATLSGGGARSLIAFPNLLLTSYCTAVGVPVGEHFPKLRGCPTRAPREALSSSQASSIGASRPRRRREQGATPPVGPHPFPEALKDLETGRGQGSLWQAVAGNDQTLRVQQGLGEERNGKIGARASLRRCLRRTPPLSATDSVPRSACPSSAPRPRSGRTRGRPTP
jgi:hypothetical protein